MLVPLQYQAKSVVLLVPPSTPTAKNPFTNLSSLSGLSDVLDQSLTAPAATAKVQSDGNVGTYTVANDVNSSGPLVIVSALSDTPVHAKKLANYVTNMIPSALQTLQNGAGIISPTALIKSIVIYPVDKTTVVKKNQTRAMLVAVAVGLLLTVLLVAATERFATRRRRRPGAGRPQPPARRSPQPRVNGTNGAHTPSVTPFPTKANGTPRPDSTVTPAKPSKSAKHGRMRRAKASDPDKDHEPVPTGR